MWTRSLANVFHKTLKEAGIPWKGLYSARRGCATMLTGLTGNVIAARAVLRHKSMLTLLGHYDKAHARSSGLRIEAGRAEDLGQGTNRALRLLHPLRFNTIQM